MSFQKFLEEFVPKIQRKSKQVNQAAWLLETTGSEDAASLKAELDTELRLFFNDKTNFENLLKWDQEPVTDPLLKRQLNVLIRAFKANQIDPMLLQQIAKEEAGLALIYSNFRPLHKGKSLSENDIREILKTEKHVAVRKETWEASKQVGHVLKDPILKIVALRNRASQSLGYSDYFSMQLNLQEVDEKWLFKMLDELAIESDAAYTQVFDEIKDCQSLRFNVSKEEIGPWAWSEPFCQEDPLDSKELDKLVEGVDIQEAARLFYKLMGFDVDEVLKKSDQYERPGKSQHAFCIHIDREGDVRTLNNIKPSIKWLETVMHELGHAVYDLGYEKELPWLLKEPPHMITTEAMALLAGRQAYRPSSLEKLSANSDRELKNKAAKSLRRRQLIFSRWVLVMTHFEQALYKNPDQDLNSLWWKLVEKYQKIKCTGSKSGCDWAAKFHIGLAPVYYYSYLLGELFASVLETRFADFADIKTGSYLRDMIFKPGNRMPWNELIEKATGDPLSAKAWLKQFALKDWNGGI